MARFYIRGARVEGDEAGQKRTAPIARLWAAVYRWAQAQGKTFTRGVNVEGVAPT